MRYFEDRPSTRGHSTAITPQDLCVISQDVSAQPDTPDYILETQRHLNWPSRLFYCASIPTCGPVMQHYGSVTVSQQEYDSIT